MGISEDPATGSAAGPLGAHLVARGVAETGALIVVAQGHELGRPSRIEVRVLAARVEVAGRGVVTAEGRLSL